MKSTERHKLKENAFAHSVARARDVIDTRGRDMATVAVVVAAALALALGYMAWRQSRVAKANTLLASALAVAEAPVVAPVAPAPGSPMPVQQPGTFQTERARLEAALPKLQQAADSYPRTDAGVAARYHSAGTLAALGRPAEAEGQYKQVIDRAGSGIYGRMAHLGLAHAQVAQGKYDAAIAVYQQLTTDTTSQIPVDGVLMELGRTYLKAGRKQEAAHAFSRVVEEFPQSLYAADARREMEDAKKS